MKAKQSAEAAAVVHHALCSDLLSLLHPSHHHVHSLLELLCAWHSQQREWDKAIEVTRWRVSNIHRVQGDNHWLEGVEWSLLGSLYAEKGDEQGRRESFSRCYDINRQCFGEQAASTRLAKSRMGP